MNTMKGWHFLQDDRRFRWGTREIVIPSKTYTAEGPLKMCQNGMHASKRIIDALQYAPGAIVCRVILEGELIHDSDKSVGRKRTVLWMLDATNILHEFACRCAESALKSIDDPDPRSFAAIKAKRDWLKGKITNKELSVARDAAWDAAWDAARAAAWNAAWDKQNRVLTAMVVVHHRKL